jgi:hypothetical protein
MSKPAQMTFCTAASGYFAIYEDHDATQPRLRNVVGWVTCVGEVKAYVLDSYTATLVAADSLPDFVSLIGPNPQSDHKAGATRIVAEAEVHRNAELVREARLRRRAGWSHPRAKRTLP